MFKLLADECIHEDLVLTLREIGIDILTAKETGLSGKGDDTVFKKAVELSRVLLTFDRGFGDIFRFDISQSNGVIILLIGKMTREELLTIAPLVIKHFKDRSLAGKLIIVSKSKVRVIER